jgi:hypothetical protein
MEERMREIEPKWLLLIHQIPPKPPYFRVKIWRRLQQVGAVPIKQSVYALPKNDQTLEDFNWLLREIKDGGGDATLCEAAFLNGITDDQVISMFREARKPGYEEIIRDAREVISDLSDGNQPDSGRVSHADGALVRLRKKMTELVAIDYFGCPERGVAEILLSNIGDILKGAKSGKRTVAKALKNFADKVWVTRANVFVDRIACAWLIKRFVDEAATFKFVASKKYKPQKDELRFDMFDAEFTHDGDLCSFEVMVKRLGLDQKLLGPLQEIVHDIDLKDQKFGRPETEGIRTVLAAIVTAHARDEDRIEIAGKLLDDLFQHFKQIKS